LFAIRQNTTFAVLVSPLFAIPHIRLLVLPSLAVFVALERLRFAIAGTLFVIPSTSLPTVPRTLLVIPSGPLFTVPGTLFVVPGVPMFTVPRTLFVIRSATLSTLPGIPFAVPSAPLFTVLAPLILRFVVPRILSMPVGRRTHAA
jgi:hypothetical protein